MNFFEHQDVARRNTRLLTLLFLLAVFLLVVLTNVLVALLLWAAQDYNLYSGSQQGLPGFLHYFRWERFGSIGLAISATVALVVAVKWFQLSTGGKVVAESMGGSRVLPQTDDPGERRLLNVVQELALAANMPVPPVYVLNSERGINAFAAGITTADAVVAVTRGAIVQFKRHELQGVIAHEFSHILNGDMRLNIRLAAMLKGITFIGDVGHFLTHMPGHRAGRGGGSDNAALPLLGIGLMVLGGVGGVAAGFIKAAISRQKEYLADASAVQFTRNPDDIGDALKVIGGYVPGTLVHAGRAIDMSHIFFGQIQHRLWQVFATHPPLNTRIIRVDPQWNGQYISRKIDHGEIEAPVKGPGRDAIVAAAVLATAALEDAIQPEQSRPVQDADFAATASDMDAAVAQQHQLPLTLVQHSHEPVGAQALVYALLLSQTEGVSQRQLGMIADDQTPELSTLVFNLCPSVQCLPPPLRLPLLEMCMPALKATSAPQYRRFKNTLLRIIRADAKTDLYEWCMFQLVRHYLDPEFIKVRTSRPRYRKLAKVQYQLRIVLSVLAHEGSADAEPAFRLAADQLGFADLQILPLKQCNVAAFSRAVTELADCYPLLKPRVLKAMAYAAASDGLLSGMEQEIIASMAAVMDCPVPTSASARELP